MNVIDLEILIPASPEFIWRFMGDLAINPQWQEDVVSISFLSTQREGPGTRWRHSTVKGSDIIIEVSAWYDTLGYEYRIVDGTAYSENKGRVRLHEVSDGTMVRWTFQYEPSGMLGGCAMRCASNAAQAIKYRTALEICTNSSYRNRAASPRMWRRRLCKAPPTSMSDRAINRGTRQPFTKRRKTKSPSMKTPRFPSACRSFMIWISSQKPCPR